MDKPRIELPPGVAPLPTLEILPTEVYVPLQYDKVGPRDVDVPKLPVLSEQLKDQLSIWEPFSIDALLILQDQVQDRTDSGLYLSDKYKKRKQHSIGTGWVIGKCRDAAHIDDRLNDINIGDRVKFPAATPITAEFPFSVPEHERVQILHLQNLIMITRCGPDSSSDILGFECNAQSSVEDTSSSPVQSE